MANEHEVLIVGAGPVGSILAERFAVEKDLKVKLIDKRNHLAGNCYDCYHDGVLIHKYGPHYFRTHNPELIRYLSRFTEWIPGQYYVQSLFEDDLYNFPINLDTLEKFFNRRFDKDSAKEFLDSIRENISSPKNSEEFVLSRVGKELFEAFYKNYTKKQWGREARELDPSVCGRVPIRLNRDDRYVDHEFQLTPKNGFTELFTKMVAHPNIEVELNVDYFENKERLRPRLFTVYTGPIDAYFNFQFGKLPWRSLDFKFVKYDVPFKQNTVQINYPNDFSFTRSVEIKHITRQNISHTVVSYETPKAEGDPYYPVPCPDGRATFKKYKELAKAEEARHVFFGGRLANFTYINMDQAMELSLNMYKKISKIYADQLPANGPTEFAV